MQAMPTEPDITPAEGPDDLPADVRETMLKQRALFAFHLACCENGAKAARLAGYAESNARAQAHRLMQEPDVVEAVAIERAERAKRLEVTEERILAAYSAMAFHDTRSIIRWNADGTAIVGSSEDLSDDEAMLVQGVEMKERYDKDGGRTVTTIVKLADRKGALDALARIKGMNKDKLDVTGVDGFAARLAARRARLKQGEGGGDVGNT